MCFQKSMILFFRHSLLRNDSHALMQTAAQNFFQISWLIQQASSISQTHGQILFLMSQLNPSFTSSIQAPSFRLVFVPRSQIGLQEFHLKSHRKSDCTCKHRGLQESHRNRLFHFLDCPFYLQISANSESYLLTFRCLKCVGPAFGSKAS